MKGAEIQGDEAIYIIILKTEMKFNSFHGVNVKAGEFVGTEKYIRYIKYCKTTPNWFPLKLSLFNSFSSIWMSFIMLSLISSIKIGK